MKNLLFVLLIALFFGSCDNEVGVIGTSDEGAISGQYSTMITAGNYMYAVNDFELITFDMTDKANPVLVDKTNVGVDIENIYESENTIFIGSRTHLYIYDLQSNGIPVKKSDTEYLDMSSFSFDVMPCDPVVASQEIAYVTLSSTVFSDDPCTSNVQVNELRAYDVSDLTKPELINTRQMHGPKGMSIDGNLLFVSNSDRGFVVYELDNKGNMTEINSETGFSSYDLIAKNGKLLVVSQDEIRQYDYSNVQDIVLASTLDLR